MPKGERILGQRALRDPSKLIDGMSAAFRSVPERPGPVGRSGGGGYVLAEAANGEARSDRRYLGFRLRDLGFRLRARAAGERAPGA